MASAVIKQFTITQTKQTVFQISDGNSYVLLDGSGNQLPKGTEVMGDSLIQFQNGHPVIIGSYSGTVGGTGTPNPAQPNTPTSPDSSGNVSPGATITSKTTVSANPSANASAVSPTDINSIKSLGIGDVTENSNGNVATFKDGYYIVNNSVGQQIIKTTDATAATKAWDGPSGSSSATISADPPSDFTDVKAISVGDALSNEDNGNILFKSSNGLYTVTDGSNTILTTNNPLAAAQAYDGVPVTAPTNITITPLATPAVTSPAAAATPSGTPGASPTAATINQTDLGNVKLMSPGDSIGGGSGGNSVTMQNDGTFLVTNSAGQALYKGSDPAAATLALDGSGNNAGSGGTPGNGLTNGKTSMSGVGPLQYGMAILGAVGVIYGFYALGHGKFSFGGLIGGFGGAASMFQGLHSILAQQGSKLLSMIQKLPGLGNINANQAAALFTAGAALAGYLIGKFGTPANQSSSTTGGDTGGITGTGGGSGSGTPTNTTSPQAWWKNSALAGHVFLIGMGVTSLGVGISFIQGSPAVQQIHIPSSQLATVNAELETAVTGSSFTANGGSFPASPLGNVYIYASGDGVATPDQVVYVTQDQSGGYDVNKVSLNFNGQVWGASSPNSSLVSFFLMDPNTGALIPNPQASSAIQTQTAMAQVAASNVANAPSAVAAARMGTLQGHAFLYNSVFNSSGH